VKKSFLKNSGFAWKYILDRFLRQKFFGAAKPPKPTFWEGNVFSSRVARWFIFKPNIPFWVNFGVP
jgi:hypothetical protein